MNVLITGASGFLGYHVKKELKDKKYTLFTPNSSELDLMNFNYLDEYLRINKFDVIIHLAAKCGGIGANRFRQAEFFEENSIMNLNILKASHHYGFAKLVTMGSVCSYPKFAQAPFKEEEIWNGYPEETNAPYGISKRLLMEGCKSYSQQYDRNFIHLIPTNLIGENDNFSPESSHVIPALIVKMEEAKQKNLEQVEVWGNGTASREFLYAGDCARGIRLAMEGYNSPSPINLGSGKEVTIRELVLLIKDVVGYNGDIVWDTTKPNGQPRRNLDVSKAKRKFGFEAEVSLKEAITRTYNWYKKYEV